MNFHNRTLRWASLPDRIRGMFNLNDPRWGRGDDKSEDGGVRPEDRPAAPPGGSRGKTARVAVPVEGLVAAFSQI